jgi:hypothetical protein
MSVRGGSSQRLGSCTLLNCSVLHLLLNGRCCCDYAAAPYKLCGSTSSVDELLVEVSHSGTPVHQAVTTRACRPMFCSVVLLVVTTRSGLVIY